MNWELITHITPFLLVLMIILQVFRIVQNYRTKMSQWRYAQNQDLRITNQNLRISKIEKKITKKNYKSKPTQNEL
jgi:hypothetical protein